MSLFRSALVDGVILVFDKLTPLVFKLMQLFRNNVQ